MTGRIKGEIWPVWQGKHRYFYEEPMQVEAGNMWFLVIKDNYIIKTLVSTYSISSSNIIFSVVEMVPSML